MKKKFKISIFENVKHFYAEDSEYNLEFWGSVQNLKKGHFWHGFTMIYLKLTLFWEKRALFGQVLQGAASEYGTLVSSGLILGKVVKNIEILSTSTKICLTLILAFFKEISF